MKFALDQIGMPPGARVGPGGADPFAATHPFDAGGPHQPGHLIAADVVTGPACRFPQLVRPVDAVVVLPQLDQAGPSTASRWARCDGPRDLAA